MGRSASWVEFRCLILIIQSCHSDAAMSELHYPHMAGMLDLEEWGSRKVPAGAHQGRTFQDIFDDANKCAQYRNRKASSQWVLSLSAFIKESDKRQSMGGMAGGV